ncbi:hypothetical protein EV363DRAFT_1158439 [Boletus edulis]|nr:hypothetical protein EV363DRAFT_1158439 [Boletus edulis]
MTKSKLRYKVETSTSTSRLRTYASLLTRPRYIHNPIFLLRRGPPRPFYPPVSRFLSIVFALAVSDVVQGTFRHEIRLQFEGVSGNVALSNA